MRNRVPVRHIRTSLDIRTNSNTHLSRSALITPEATSMTPTNLNTLFSLNASDLNLSNSWSYSGSFLMNSSPDPIPSNAAGTKDLVLTDL